MGRGGGGGAGLFRPVSAEAARLAAAAGVLPAHAQMAHEVSQVGTREEGHAAAEAAAAAAAAGNSPGRRPGDEARAAVVDPAASSARLLRLAHALEQAEAEYRVAKGVLPVRHLSGGGAQRLSADEPSAGWEAAQGAAGPPSPVALGARTPSPVATGWGRSRRVFPARPGSSGGGGSGREPLMSPAEAALLQQQYGVAVARAAQQRRDAAEANVARHRGLDAEAVPVPGHAMDRQSRRVT